MMLKEEILNQVNAILQSVQSIVSHIQHVSQNPNEEEQFWWDECQNVNVECQSYFQEYENCSKLSTTSLLLSDVKPAEIDADPAATDEEVPGPACSDEHRAEVHHALLRAFVEADPEHGGVVTRQSFARLLDTAADVLAAHGDCADILEDEDAMQAMFEAVNLSKSGLITYNEWCVFCREHLATSATPVSPSSTLSDQYTLYYGDESTFSGDESEETAEQQPGQNDIVMSNLLSCVSYCAPNLIFNPKKSARLKKKKWRKRTKKELHPHLLRMWQHSSELFSPPDAPPATVPAPASPYPVVDWSQVNKRFLGNLPEPTPFPLSGCSPDEKFYRDCDKQGSYTNTRWMLGDAFGSRRGYMTEDGVIAPSGNGQTLHGYVWSDEFRGWVLQTKKKDAKKKVPFNHKQKLERKEKLR